MHKKFEITAVFLNNINQLISSSDKYYILELLENMHPADIAEILSSLSKEKAQYLFEIIDEKKSADVVVELEDEIRESLLSDLTSKEIAEEVIDNLESDDAADVIGELSGSQQKEVLSHIESLDHASGISDLLSYPEDSAGGLMAKELICVNENWNTKQCLKEMRKQAEQVKQVYSVYVVDNKNKLLGTVSLRQLLLSKTSLPIKGIVKKDIKFTD